VPAAAHCKEVINPAYSTWRLAWHAETIHALPFAKIRCNGACARSSRAPILELFFAMLFRWTLVLCLSALATAGGQQRFITQVMIVPAFRAPDRDIGGRASDVVRGRVADAFQRSELRVISGGDIDEWLRLSGFEENSVLTDGELREMAKKFRADERITGTVERIAGKVRVRAALTLVRDVRLTQPLTADGATVTEAADLVAREAIAARRQLVPLRQCENFIRGGKLSDAAAAAAVGIAAYPRAVPARLCLLNALTKQGAPSDSVISVARAALAVAADNPTALGTLGEAYDTERKYADAAPIWVRLLATDTTSEELVERVVNALSRGGSSRTAQPLIDRGTEEHPDNLPLLKLRWLVHLANGDWKGAIATGEQLLARDPASRADPDFHVRFANAYRADSQPLRALAIAAAGVAAFPKDAPLYVTYLQLVRGEFDSAIPRGLAAFPDSPEIHVLAAQSMKSAGNTAGALLETKRALAANPRLPHGYLQVAQLEIDAGEIDSAYAATEVAEKFGESEATVAAFALARGNGLYKAATATQKRDDYLRAMKFLSLATRMVPTAESKFLLGASALSVSQSASTDAPATKSCELSRLADSSLTEAEINLASGGSVAPDAAKQYLDYAAKLRPYVADQVKNYC
jgi:tetratricopeptide (TPR) repeat protein